MTELEIRWDKLDDLYGSMNEVGRQSNDVTAYFRTRVCDTSGFDYHASVLRPIADVLPELAGVFDEAQGIFARRWSRVADAIETSARNLDRVDESISIDLDRMRGQGPTGTQMGPHLTVTARLFEPAPLTDVLVDPEAGAAELNHNNTFDWVADTWDDAVSTINQGIGMLRRLGFSVSDLPIQSLREYVVYPLSADYGQIRTNANACGVLNDGMATWGGNFTLLSANVGAVMLGQTSLSLVAHLNLYHLAVAGMGQGVGAGALVFDEIASVSERIAIEVEDALVLLGKRVAKLARKIGTRLIPYVGWAVALLELMSEGKEMFTDIVRDIELMIALVEDLLQLVDDVKAWAQTAAERLETFEQILDAAKDLPLVRESEGVEDLLRNMSTAETALQDIATFGEDDGEERDTLEGTLHDLGEAHNEALAIDADDDAIIMAPGPLGPTVDPETGELVYGGESSSLPTA